MIDVPQWSVRGFIPTAWYPNHLVLNREGTKLAVATLLGVGSGFQEQSQRRQVHAYRGTVSVVPVPDAAELDSYTTAVAENNHIATARQQLADERRRARRRSRCPNARAIPRSSSTWCTSSRRTAPTISCSAICRRATASPSFVMFGEDVTPNHRKLATEFVLLDNFYATGGNSGDGHQWATQASETAYAMWPGYVGRSYPFDGTDPIAYANTGFLWDLARARGKTVRVYGEFAGRLPESDPGAAADAARAVAEAATTSRENWSITAPLAPLNAVLAKNYPPYSQSMPDVVRAQIFLKDLGEWVKSGQHAEPRDSPAAERPHARRDAGRVDAAGDGRRQRLSRSARSSKALSQSPFWPKMAILVVEDDAQNGVDHVDGHRTIALAISPYIRRGAVDSTFYAQQSMVKTIELMLGLPTMSLFDLIATDMRASFTTDARPPAVRASSSRSSRCSSGIRA